MTKNVGIIDSGIGGLSILNTFLKISTGAKYYYISDEQNVPYGGKPQEFMLAQVCKMVEQLIEKNVDLIILACNTLTVETINLLRKKYDLPFYGIEPYINYLNKEDYHCENNYGLILTEATSKSKRFKELKEKCDPLDIIKVYPLKNLAMIIQTLKENKAIDFKEQIKAELNPIVEDQINHLILGCTHYPLISQEIESLLEIKTIDPHKNVVEYIIDQSDFLTQQKNQNPQEIEFYYNPDLSKWTMRTLQSFVHLDFKNNG